MENPELRDLKQRIPHYAKSQQRNLEVLLNSSVLTPQQKWGCLLVSAALSKNAYLLKTIDAQSQKFLSDTAKEAALACIATMTLNNCGFRAKHWLDTDFEDVRFGLRNTVDLKPGISQADYEVWAIAASAINGCEQCIQAHSQTGQDEGLKIEQLWEAVKIASVISSLAQILHVHEVIDN